MNDDGNKTVSAIIKESLLNFTTTSSAHGLPRVFTSKEWILRIMWLLLFLASAAYMIYSCSLLLIGYLEYPTSVSISTIQEIPTKFPSVTFCNQKLIDKTKNSNFIKNFSNEYIEDSNISYSFSYDEPYGIISDIIYDSQQYYNELFDNERDLSYSISDMLVSCQFNKATCDENDFILVDDPRRGSCYTFNKGSGSNGSDIKTVSSALGPKTGLVLELYVGNPDIDTYFEFNDGIILSIHNQSFKPFTEDLELKAAAGAETDFIIRRNFITKLGSPYGRCLEILNSTSSFSSEIFDYIVRNQSETYSQRYCFSLCQQKATMDICHCSNYDLPVYGSIDSCFNFTETKCKDDVIANFSTSQYKSRLEACIKSCPDDCSSIEYNVVSHSSLYPNKYYAENILSFYVQKNRLNLSTENIYKAFVKVNIYYDSMQYTSIVESPSITLQAIIANVGGYFGLCMGLSLLSLIEIIDLIIRIIVSIFLKFKNKKNQIIVVQEKMSIQINE
jgi:hypothetical protein